MAIPAILQQLQQNNTGNTILSKFRQAADLMRGNPNALLQNNPNYQAAMQIVQQNGGDARSAFMNLARQLGLDPEEAARMLR